MVFSKIAEFISSARTHFSSPESSNAQYKPAGLPSQPTVTGFSFCTLGQKNKVRVSGSLQDFSACRQLDLEEGGPKPEANLLLRENGGSSFSKEKSSSGISSPQKKWTRVILLLLCFLLLAFLLYSVICYANLSQRKSEYYVVLDCGSTGTRVYVYQTLANHRKDDSFPILLRSLPESFRVKSNSKIGRLYNRMETDPGFDKLVHNISGLKRAIKPLIHWAEKQIPTYAHKSTSLYLYATAGLRRLPSSDSEWLLDNAWSILKSSPFSCKRESVRIISGTEEAYFGWIALNYHTRRLGAMPKQETFGALDLGGSSLQVTFENKEALSDKTNLKLSIGTIDHHLSAYSLSGYGLNDAFDRSVFHLLKKLPKLTNAELVSGQIEIKHPCLQSGYKEQYICSNCASVYQEGEHPPVGGKMPTKGGKPGVAIKLVGAPKWDKCSELAKIAVNLSEWSDQAPALDCEVQPCALSGNLPRPHGQFYAISGFYVVYRFFNLTPDAALDDVLEKGREFCEKTWDDAKNSVTPQPFIEQYCFRAPYIVLLLRDGLHIADGHVTIGSGSITWTLGVALLESGKALSKRVEFWSYETFLMNIKPFALYAFLVVSLFILLCALSCVSNWVPKFFRRLYLPLFRHSSTSTTSIINIPAPFRFQRWSPITSGDGRVKMPHSPTISGTQNSPFQMRHGFSGSSVQLSETSLQPSFSGVSHSKSSNSLWQMQFDNSAMNSFWSTQRSQMQLQSRRSQSREDLNSSLTEAHIVKV